MAGFPFGPQPIWSRLHTVELASYRLRKDSMKFPALRVIESFPHGLTGRVPRSLPSINKNPDNPQGVSGFLCRSGGIRTRGLLVPNQTRYQTALHLEAGADEGTRTPDLLITNRLLYQLSHIGTTSDGYYIKAILVCPALFSAVRSRAGHLVFPGINSLHLPAHPEIASKCIRSGHPLPQMPMSHIYC